MGLKSVTAVLGVLIIVACLLLIYLLNFTDNLDEKVQGNKKMILSLILLGYAIFRAYRLIILMKTKNKE